MPNPNEQEMPEERSANWLYLNIGAAVTVMLVAGAFFWWMIQQPDASGEKFEQQMDVAAPAFSLPALTGEIVSLEELRGDVVLLNFWATWCPPCIAELPTIGAFYEEYRDDGFTVLAVNGHEDSATIEAFIAEKGFTFPVLIDEGDTISAGYDVRALPVTFIIDREGVVRHVQRGEISRTQLESMVLPLLAK